MVLAVLCFDNHHPQTILSDLGFRTIKCFSTTLSSYFNTIKMVNCFQCPLSFPVYKLGEKTAYK